MKVTDAGQTGTVKFGMVTENDFLIGGLKQRLRSLHFNAGKAHVAALQIDGADSNKSFVRMDAVDRVFCKISMKRVMALQQIPSHNGEIQIAEISK